MNNTRLTQALATLTPDVALALTTSLGQQGFTGKIPASIITPVLNQPEKLMPWLTFAAQFAITPVSNFNVGALVIGNSGAAYIGANMEFAGQALSQSVHGEQAAINNAWLHGETGISHLFVNASPCGHCRQFIREIAQHQQLQVYVLGKDKIAFNQLLPDSFGPDDLGNKFALFEQPQQVFVASEQSPVIDEIVEHANASYAPYTGYYHAIGLITSDDQLFVGRYAENVAYNPSLPALQSALSQLRFTGYDVTDIKRSILVHKTGQNIDMAQHYSSLLRQLNALNLDLVELS
ncbi:cytidine deaminase [Motilimonas cestriensis]|uniref:Cytidine deaminase n=1 Tax=Motilimonas cestriensis TaxID=2742685 RepID=A0ABS8W9F3_9GAMM|nr:cytidine deaminase [Motilimonas cestriensis]MCE2594885.1 cytidine deaminase [Motilimonas cestriensis]